MKDIQSRIGLTRQSGEMRVPWLFELTVQIDRGRVDIEKMQTEMEKLRVRSG